MTVPEKLAALRAAMEEKGVDGVYVPSADPHMSEYLPEHWRSRAWLSGFTGSAGTLCVTKDKAALWTDGRHPGSRRLLRKRGHGENAARGF